MTNEQRREISHKIFNVEVTTEVNQLEESQVVTIYEYTVIADSRGEAEKVITDVWKGAEITRMKTRLYFISGRGIQFVSRKEVHHGRDG